MSGIKPGDVAEVRWASASGAELAFYQGAHQWLTESGIHLNGQGIGFSARPLVVIDPEDADQVKRLLDSLRGMSFAAHACGAFTCMQGALREFANPTPPKPDEPTGLGAVVEDADGVWYVRVNHDPPTDDPWKPYGSRSARCTYDDIDAVRVLSPGVEDA